MNFYIIFGQIAAVDAHCCCWLIFTKF